MGCGKRRRIRQKEAGAAHIYKCGRDTVIAGYPSARGARLGIKRPFFAIWTVRHMDCRYRNWGCEAKLSEDCIL